ncbi:hypothetical protein D3C83_299850 [compost metagenome]
MLAAVVTEDFRKVQRLAVIGLGGGAEFPDPAGVALTRQQLVAGGAAKPVIEAAIRAAG